jgi:hypothetical protein
MQNGSSIPSTLIVIVPAGVEHADQLQSLRDIVGATRFANIAVRSWPNSGPALALGDGPDVRLRCTPFSDVVQFAGANVTAEWLSIVQALPAAGDRLFMVPSADESLGRLYTRRSTLLVNEAATLGLGPEARTVAAAIDELQAFQDRLLTAIVDPELLTRDPGHQAPPEPDSTERKFDRQRPLGEQLAFLFEERDVLSYHLSLSPPPPWASYTRLAAYELLPVLTAVLSEPSRRSIEGELHILANGVSEATQSPSLVNLVRTAVVDHGWAVHIGIGMAGEQSNHSNVREIVSCFRAAIPSPRLRFRGLPRPAPAHALVIDDLAFVAGGDWLRPTLVPQFGAADFGFAIESREFAESLRACFEGAYELSPS